METLKFVDNSNNKLNCNIFTTLRPYQPKKYFPGAEFRVLLGNDFFCNAKVIEIGTTKLEVLNEKFFLIDMGKEKPLALAYLRSLYNASTDFDGYWHFIFLKKLKKCKELSIDKSIKYLEKCPQCQKPWHWKEVQNQTCYFCGYPEPNDNY